MSQEPENVLRKSLDAVDQGRRRLTWVLAIAGVVAALEFYRLAEVKQTGDVPRTIFQAVLVLSSWTLGLTVLLVFQLAIATKRILRAIELASRRAE